MPRTAEQVLTDMLGRQALQIALLTAQIEALQEQLAKAQPKPETP